MEGRKWKKWVTLAAVTGMLVSQIGIMPTWAAEEQDVNVVIETAENCETEEPAETVEDFRAIEAEEEIVGETSGLTWTVEGDTIIIAGEGEFEPVKDTLQSAMDAVKHVRFENCKVIGSMAGAFEGLSNLESIDFSGLDTSRVTDMSYMFYGCSNLHELDLAGFNTSCVTNMRGMFRECKGLTSLDLSSFDTSQVTDMNSMFHYCPVLSSLDISSFNTKKVTDMGYMFGWSFWLTELDVSHFDTSQVTNMDTMFSGCNITSLDLSGFDTSKVTNMRAMFSGCSFLANLDVSSFDTSQVTDMGYMFCGCSRLMSLDLNGFDMTNVYETGDMFKNCQFKELRTPNAMSSDCTIALNGTYYDPAGRETDVLTNDFLSTVLTLVEDTPAVPEPVKFTVVGTIGGRNVTFSSDTEDAVIYYSSTTSKLTTEDACVQNGETVLFENFYGTLYARAYADGQWSNVSRLILKIPVVSKPVISGENGVVTIKTSTPNSTIYYTTDGSTPSLTNGKRLTNSAGSFTVPANCTVKAIAVRSCFTNSEITSASVTAKKLGAPSFAVKGVIGGRAVTFNTTESQGEIYYSFTTSNITTKDLHVKPGETVLFENYYGTVYARTYVNGQWSNVSRLILKIPVVNTPTITNAGNGRVKISTSTPNCAIYYTTDGSIPSPTNGTRINSSSSVVTVGSGKTVKAIAVRSCFTNSDVATYKK